MPDGSKKSKAPGAHLKPYRKAKNVNKSEKVKKASSQIAVQAALSNLKKVSLNQTNSVSVSDKPCHSHSNALCYDNIHHTVYHHINAFAPCYKHVK